MAMEESDKDADKTKDEITELEAKLGELEIKATEVRAKVQSKEDDWKR